MAEHREPSETERLLAEVDAMLSPGGHGSVPAQRPGDVEGVEGSSGGGLRRRFRGALVAGAVAGAGVWVLFALLPFLRATSGGVGAFLAVTVAALLLRS